MDLVGGFTNFIAKNVFGQRGVSRANRLNERAKIFQALAIPVGRAVGVRQAQPTPAPDPAVQDGEHGRKGFTLRTFKEHFVEIVFGNQHGRGVARIISFLDGGEGQFETHDLRLVSVFRKEAGRQAFENGADGINLSCFLDGERAHYRSLVGDDGYKAFGFQLAQGFADDGAGDAHHGDEFALDKALAGVEAAGDDGVAKFVEDLATERRGGLGDGREDRSGAK